jgi:hypothetical protein
MDLDYKKFSDSGFEIKKLPSRLDNKKIDLFLWSNFVDAKGDFFEIEGKPVRVLIPDTVKPFWEIVHDDVLQMEKWLSDRGYRKLSLTQIESLQSLWLQVDSLLSERHPQAKKGLVFYDYSRLSDPDLLKRMQQTQAEMKETLSLKGWRIFQLPENFPKYDKDNNWAHYDQNKTKDFMKMIYKEFGFADKDD